MERRRVSTPKARSIAIVYSLLTSPYLLTGGRVPTPQGHTSFVRTANYYFVVDHLDVREAVSDKFRIFERFPGVTAARRRKHSFVGVNLDNAPSDGLVWRELFALRSGRRTIRGKCKSDQNQPGEDGCDERSGIGPFHFCSPEYTSGGQSDYL